MSEIKANIHIIVIQDDDDRLKVLGICYGIGAAKNLQKENPGSIILIGEE